MRSDSSVQLADFVRELKSRNLLPRHIELSKVGHVHMAGVYDNLGSKLITESVSVGMDGDSDLAVLKALVEKIERKAISEGQENRIPSCETERSDGFAAYPASVKNSVELARKNALSEAIERYVWASWWDNADFVHEQLDENDHDFLTGSLLSELKKIISVQKIKLVTPNVSNANGERVLIYFAFTEPHGVISGGACGDMQNINKTKFRAASELMRHGLAIRKMKAEKLSPETFYERRLAYFGITTEGQSLVQKRLAQAGSRSIKLPVLQFDEVIPHSLSDLVTVHRCLFANQPPFVGGALERLCL